MFPQETKYAQLAIQFYWINCLIFNLGFFGFYLKAITGNAKYISPSLALTTIIHQHRN